MNTPLFPNGIKGLADSKYSAYEGECDKLVGIDFRNTPGIIKAHQKLTKNSGTTVTELCKNKVELSDGSIIWFSSESGKIWKQVGDTFTLIHTVVPATDYKEPNSIINGIFDDSDKENGISLSIAENNAVYGDISSNVSSIFETVNASDVSAVELSSGRFGIGYKGVDGDGFVKIFQMTSSGVYSEIDSLEHDTTEASSNSLCRIDNSHMILAYENTSNGFIKTFDSLYSLSQINSLTHENYNTLYNSLIQIDSTHYALACAVEDKPYINLLTSSGWSVGTGWTGDYNTGFVKSSNGTTPGIVSSFVPTIGKQYEVTFTISSLTAYDVQFEMGGHVSTDYAANGTYSYTTTACTTTSPFTIVTDNTAARLTVSNIQVKELIYGALLKIFTIDGSYNITQTSSMWYETYKLAFGNKLVLIDSTHLMLAYSTDTDQNIKTFTIDGSWNITETDSLSHTTNISIQQGLMKFDATHYIWGGMIGTRGYVKVFEIDGSYQITEKSALDIKSYNYYPSFIKNDETHIVLSSSNSTTGYSKVFEIDSNYIMKEIAISEFSGGVDTNTIRNNRQIIVVHQNGSTGTVNSITMNETYSNGIILKPSDTSEIKLIASKMISQISTATQYLTTKIKIPEGYSNLDVVVIAGRCASEVYPPVGVTVEGNAMTQICNRTTSYGFKASSAIYNYINPTTGDNNISIDFGIGGISYLYGIVLVFANVHQTTAYSATVDYGWQDYLELPGVTNKELRIGAFLSKVNTHYAGELQTQVVDMNIAENTDIYTISVGLREFSIGTAKILGAADFSYVQSEIIGSETESYQSEEQKQKIYYCNEDVLFALPIDKISSWATDVETIGVFKNGDDTYHSMVKQNLELYIGDKTVLAKVNSNGEFIPETALNVMSPERIQVLSPYDTDILIGTKIVNKARVLRWDTFSDSWIADDDIIETGINAFILDDDYTYVSAGDFGHIYFYNGEKLNITKKIPGDWDSTHMAKINANSVGYLKGVPVFGLSNITGNPTLQGIYGFGGYDSKYPKSLSLDFPMPTNEFSGIEIGAININGSNMYVSYKTATDVGIAKLDHSNKYNNAYLETALLGSLSDRDDYSIHEGICADYILLPTNTSIELSTKTKYQTDYSAQDTITDTDKLSIKTKSSIPDTLNLQIKVNLVSSVNNSPEIENIGIL